MVFMNALHNSNMNVLANKKVSKEQTHTHTYTKREHM